MTVEREDPNVTTDPTSEPLRTLLERFEALQTQINTIGVDLNKRDIR